MIVNRRTFVIKRGRLGEAQALVMAEVERTGTSAGFRLYLPSLGEFDRIAMEWEYESLSEYERQWNEFFSSPESAPFLEKWVELTETGGTNEIWMLAE